MKACDLKNGETYLLTDSDEFCSAIGSKGSSGVDFGKDRECVFIGLLNTTEGNRGIFWDAEAYEYVMFGVTEEELDYVVE